MKNKNCIYHILISLFILVLLIPFTLNVVLQCEFYAGKIIGGTDSPHVWLVFWGAYLSAIGTGVMAYVAYRQGSDERKRNAMRIEYEAKQKEYDLFEEQLIRFANTYNPLTFRQIYINIKEDNISKVSELYMELHRDLDIASLYAARFHNQRLSAQMHTFYKALAQFNIKFVELRDKLSLLMKQNAEDVEYSNLFDEAESEVDKLCRNFNNKDLVTLGFNALLEMQKDLEEMVDKMK